MQLIKRYVHHILSLKCTWPSISAKFGFCWRRVADLSLSANHFPCR